MEECFCRAGVQKLYMKGKRKKVFSFRLGLSWSKCQIQNKEQVKTENNRRNMLIVAALPEPEPVIAGVFGWSRSRFFHPAPAPSSGSGFKIYPVYYTLAEYCMSKVKKKAKSFT